MNMNLIILGKKSIESVTHYGIMILRFWCVSLSEKLPVSNWIESSNNFNDFSDDRKYDKNTIGR